jgi:hypothetical protein
MLTEVVNEGIAAVVAAAAAEAVESTRRQPSKSAADVVMKNVDGGRKHTVRTNHHRGGQVHVVLNNSQELLH